MATPQYIIDFDKQMTDRHTNRKEEQEKDMGFFNNDYLLPLIKKRDYQMRTNFPARMINAVTQQLITKLPKIYVKPNADTEVAKKASIKLSIVLNDWISYLTRQPVNLFDETFKNYNIMGESWIYTPHNMMFGREYYPDTPPVHFILYDPMVVYTEPSEEMDGEPNRVLVKYERTVSELKKAYPNWSNPKNSEDNKRAKFRLYFDGKKSYAEADEEPLFIYKMGRKKGKLLNGTGERDNLYGCVPFSHLYSGWGKMTRDMSPEMLAYSRIRMIRNLVTEDSQVRSDRLYNFHGFAFQSKTLFVPAGAEVGKDWAAAFKNDPDKLNLIYLPESATPDWFKKEDSQLFDAAAYAYSDRVTADLMQEFPSPLQGTASGTSGRQEDILSGAAHSVYNCAVDNTSGIWSRALSKALKVAEAMDMLPEGISEDDLKRYKEITVDLRTDDPVSRDRQINMGSTLVDQGKRSLKTFLVEDMRMTEVEAEEEIDNILVDRIMLQSPDIAAFLGFKAAEKSGMADELQAYNEQQGGQVDTGNATGSKGGEPRQGNIQTPTGREQIDVSQTSTGQRRPPQ